MCGRGGYAQNSSHHLSSNWHVSSFVHVVSGCCGIHIGAEDKDICGLYNIIYSPPTDTRVSHLYLCLAGFKFLVNIVPHSVEMP